LRVLLSKLQVIKVVLYRKKYENRPTFDAISQQKLSCLDSASRNPATSGMRKIDLRDIEKIFRAPIPLCGILAWTPHPTFTFYARRTVKRFESMYTGKLARAFLYTKENARSKFVSLSFYSHSHWKCDFQTDTAPSPTEEVNTME
jgi:hypothetical protein